MQCAEKPRLTSSSLPCTHAVPCSNLDLATLIPNSASGNFTAVPRQKSDFVAYSSSASVPDQYWENCRAQVLVGGELEPVGRPCVNDDSQMTSMFVLLPANVSRVASVNTCAFPTENNDTMLAYFTATKSASSEFGEQAAYWLPSWTLALDGPSGLTSVCLSCRCVHLATTKILQ